MTVAAQNNALRNFTLGRCEALRVSNAAYFLAANMMKVKCRWMFLVAAIYATRQHFLFSNPDTNTAKVVYAYNSSLLGIILSPSCQSFTLPNSPWHTLGTSRIATVLSVLAWIETVPLFHISNNAFAILGVVGLCLAFNAIGMPVTISLISSSVKENDSGRHRRNTISCL